MSLALDQWDALERESPRPATGPGLPARAGLWRGLVARDRELADLDRMLSLARHRRAAAVVLRGETGTGKSALLEAAVARARDFRVIELRGVAGQEGGIPAHWPPAIVALLERHARPEAMPQAGTGPSNGHGDAARIDECADALRSVIEDAVRPVLIAVDDCQYLPAWLPAALATALTTALASTPVALVMAWTDGPGGSPVDLGQADVTEHVVQGLPTIALCSRLLEQYGYRDIAPPVLEWLFAQTRGNPLCLVDGYSRLTSPQRADWQPLPPVVPMGTEIVAAYGSALSGLSADVAGALGVVAAGRVKTSEYRQIFADLHLDPDALTVARDHRILVQRGDRVDFAHPLVAAASYHLLPEDLRRAAHRVLALTMSGHGNIERGAYHASLAASRPNQEVAAHHEQAARRALERGAPRDAARHEEAAALFAPLPDGQAQCLARASARWLMASESRRAAHCAARALELAVTPAVRATVLHQEARVRLQASAGEEVVQLLRDAVTACGPEDPVLAVLAHLDAAACLVLGARYAEAVAQSSRAVAIAMSLNSQLAALTRAMHGVVRLLAGVTHDPVSDIANPVAQLMRESQRVPTSPQVAFTIGLGALLSGPPEVADQWARWMHECATLTGDQPLSSVAPLIHAMARLVTGRCADVGRLALDAADMAEAAGLTILATRARAVHGFLSTARHDANGALQASALVLGDADDVGPLPRVLAKANLALLELEAFRVPVSRTWVEGALEFSRDTDVVGLEFSVILAPLLGVLCLLSGSADDTRQLLASVEPSLTAATGHSSLLWMLRGISQPDLELGLEHLHRARSTAGTSPMLRAHVELCAGARLAAAARPDEARPHLEQARSAYAQLGAHCFAALADPELVVAPVPGRPEDGATVTVVPSAAPAAARSALGQPPVGWTETEPEWEICLLGGFGVSRRHVAVDFPQGLAAQALKIVALHKRIHVDELVEMLWPEAAPGVGSRRLRNILWRIRGICGDLLQRESNLICLVPVARTDIDRFDAVATAALTCDGTADDVARLAADAVVIYRGELLPGDRYADWAAAFREALLRRHASMLELLVTASLADGRTDQALAFLERLIETDPFEEHYYLQVAEIHVGTGQFHRARNALERASRMLEDLGVPPSPALLRATRSLPQD